VLSKEYGAATTKLSSRPKHAWKDSTSELRNGLPPSSLTVWKVKKNASFFFAQNNIPDPESVLSDKKAKISS
jgi:hypothetical protein